MTTLAEQVAGRVDAILARLAQPAPRPQADDVEVQAAVWAKCVRAGREAADGFEDGSPEYRGAWRVYAAILAADEGSVWASAYSPKGGG